MSIRDDLTVEEQNRELRQYVHGLLMSGELLHHSLERLWEAVEAYGLIGHEGSELLEAMSFAREVLGATRGVFVPAKTGDCQGEHGHG